MALDGNHSIGSGGHVDDHNLIDAALTMGAWQVLTAGAKVVLADGTTYRPAAARLEMGGSYVNMRGSFMIQSTQVNPGEIVGTIPLSLRPTKTISVISSNLYSTTTYTANGAAILFIPPSGDITFLGTGATSGNAGTALPVNSILFFDGVGYCL